MDNFKNALEVLLTVCEADPKKLQIFLKGYEMGKAEGTTPTPSLMNKQAELLPFYPGPKQETTPVPTAKSNSYAANRGTKAKIMRLLTTGATHIDDLQKAAETLDIPKNVFYSSLRNMVIAQLVTQSEGNLVALTAAGWPEANYYKMHPEAKMYLKSKNKKQ